MPRTRRSGSRALRARLSALDLRLLRLLRSRAHPPAAETGVIVLARAGEHGVVWYGIALGGALLDAARRPAYVRAAAVVVATLAVNSVVKRLVQRARPALEDLPALAPVISGRSYPSAHSSTSFAGARSLSAVLPGPALYVLALSMALSRPYLGVHYPSDVLAGALLGEAMGRLLGP